MAVYVRAKRVTDPLNEKVKACLSGRDHRQTSYNSGSGSDHSPCLSDLVHGFLEDESNSPNHDESSDSDHDSMLHEPVDAVESFLNPPSDSDPFRIHLHSLVLKAVKHFVCERSNMSVFRRKVMTSLRDSGYNAAICKTKWENSGGLTAGNYEFIDVVSSDDAWQQRYIVDVDFAGEFEIARPTAIYERLLSVLPKVYVGRTEELKQMVRIMADAAKRSLKSRELSLPPWRKNRYMQNKWFGPYKRTVNQGLMAPISFPVGLEKFPVKCRSVGFDAVNGAFNRFVFPPPVTRTR